MTEKPLSSYDSKAVIVRQKKQLLLLAHFIASVLQDILHWGYKEAFVFSVDRSWPFSATVHNSKLVLYFSMSFLFIAKQTGKLLTHGQ